MYLYDKGHIFQPFSFIFSMRVYCKRKLIALFAPPPLPKTHISAIDIHTSSRTDSLTIKKRALDLF